MKKLIRNSVLFGLTLLASNAFGQITQADNLNWITTAFQTSATSPNFACCSDSVNYTVSTPALGNFRHASASGNPALTTGAIFPGNTDTNPLQVQIDFTFNQDIQNLRIRIHDLDGNANVETITGISPAFNSLTDDVGTLSNPNGVGTDINAATNNTSGWINWTGTIAANTPITLLYNRPGTGHGLVIDSIEFQCPDATASGCICEAFVDDKYFQGPNENGLQTTGLSIDTQGELVSSVTIELPYYVSNVNDDCLMCDVANQESFGTILGASPIAGTPGILFDPLSLGYSRKIVYNFPTPIAISQVVDVSLKFPPVLDLSCCKNDVSFCLDVTLKKEDCSTCEYTICSKQSTPGGNKSLDSGSNEIFVEGFEQKLVEEIDGLEISPNPASDYIHVNVIDETLMGLDMSITSSNGSKVKTLNLRNRSNKIDISDLPSGMYIISVNSSSETSFKLIID